MEIKQNYIPHNFRNKYLKNTSGYASSSSSNVSTGNGLPYVLDENGNYVVEKQVLFKKSIISKEEVVAYGEDNVDYVGVYAPFNHQHTVDDVTGLKEILDNIEVGSGGTASIEVIDSLDSVSSTDALSARQGKILSDLIADKSSVSSWNDIKDKPTTFPPSTHNHTVTEITGLQSQLDSKAASSHSHVISGITGLSTELGNKANVNHSHSISAITNLQNQLDSKAASSHTHSISSITNLQTELNKKSNTGHTHTVSDITNLKEGLPYTVDSAGNYIIDKKVIFNETIISKGEVVAYGEDDKKYVATYAPLNHSHGIDDITGLKEILDNVGSGGSGGTGGTGSVEVVDNLESTSSTAALSARQGKVLSELIADKTVTWDTLQNKPSSFTPSAHSHAISGVTGLQTQLDSKASSSHTHSIANISNLQTELNGKASASHTHAISGVTSLQAELNKKSNTGHTHDDRYYTESEVNSLLSGKTNNGHTHTIANVTGLQGQLDSKASNSHTHTIANVTNLQAELNKKSDTAHTHDNRYYTETEINSLLAAKASSSHTHTIANISNLQAQLDSKAASSHSHAISAVTGLQTQLDSKASGSHSHSISGITGLQGQLDSKAASSHTHTIANVTNLQAELNKKSNTGHTHDDRYYTETEVNNLLAAKAASSHTHTIDNITNLQIELNNKSNVNHTHVISAITGLQTQLDSKVNTSDISTLNVKNSDTVDNLHASSFMRSDTNTTCTGTINCANLVATGEVTSYSDKRLKTDIQSLDNRGLLNPVTYIKDNKQQIGFIAQEVQEVYPELITEDANGYLSLNYQQLTAVLSSQINNLYSIIDELKLEISRLKNEIK